MLNGWGTEQLLVPARTQSASAKRIFGQRQPAQCLLARVLFAAVAYLAVCFPAGDAGAVDLKGLGQPAAIDQPQVYMSLHRTEGGAPIIGKTTDFFGDTHDTIGIQAYLDTGASGILISNPSKGAWHIDDSFFNGQLVGFEDIGVAGSAQFTVSTPIFAKIAPFTPEADPEDQSKYEPVNNPVAVNKPWTPLRLQMEPDPQNGEPVLQDVNVVGMPAMKGKVVLIDARRSNVAMREIAQEERTHGSSAALFSYLENVDNVQLKTYVYDPMNGPPVAGTAVTNLHVQMSYADFTDFTSTTPSGAPGPTLTHNPFVGPNPLLALPGNPYNIAPDGTPKVKLSFGGQSAEGSFLLDTGAAASFVSQKIAGQLRVRYVLGTEDTDSPVLERYTPNSGQPRFDGDKYPGASAGSVEQFKVTIGGVGGENKTVAGFYLDSFLLRTKEGNAAYDNDPRHLLYRADPANDKLGAAVLVLDIKLQNGGQSLILDGDFGVNFLSGSLFLDAEHFLFADFTPGAFDWINFDETNNVLGLQLNSNFRMKGDFNLDGKITNADIQAMLNALNDINAYQTAKSLSPADLLTVTDINSDGVTNNADINTFLKFLAGEPLPPGMQLVPEPASALLALFGAAAVLFVRRRQKTN